MVNFNALALQSEWLVSFPKIAEQAAASIDHPRAFVARHIGGALIRIPKPNTIARHIKASRQGCFYRTVLMQKNFMKKARPNGMFFIHLLQLCQQGRVVLACFLSQAQQNHIFGCAITRKVIQLASRFGLRGADQSFDQGRMGLQNKSGLFFIPPKFTGPFCRIGFKGQSCFAGIQHNIFSHAHRAAKCF